MLKNQLAPHFSRNSRLKGEIYYNDGRVTDLNVTATFLSAVVEGQMPYSVLFDWQMSSSEIEVSCTCLQFDEGFWCKHIWATILASEASDLVPDPMSSPEAVFYRKDAARASNIPRGHSNFSPELSAALEFDEEEVPKPSLHPWRFQLDRIGGSFVSRLDPRNELPDASAHLSLSEIWYQLELKEAGIQTHFSIRLHARTATKAGRPGKLKPLRIREEEIGRLPDGEDKELLRRLIGNRPKEEYYHFGNLGASFEGAWLSQFHQDELLPRLCATGRFGVSLRQGRTVNELVPVEWDDGPAWKFEMEFFENGNRWAGKGDFIRPEERCAVTEPAEIFASGLMLRAGRLSKIALADDLPWIEQLRRGEGISVPINDLDAFVKKLAEMPFLPKMNWPENFSWKLDQSIPTKQFNIFSYRDVANSHLLGELSFDYGNVVVPLSKEQAAVAEPGSRTVRLRDREFELSALREVLSHGAQKPPHNLRFEGDVVVPTHAFLRTVRGLLATDWKVESERVAIRPLQKFKIEIISGVDWFDLKIMGRKASESVNLPHLLEVIRKSGSLVRLGDGTQGLLPEKWLAQYATLAQLGEVHGDALRFKKSQGVLLDVLLQDQAESLESDTGFRQIVSKIRGSEKIRVEKEPDGFQGSLRRYQREGLGWLKYLNELGIGGCLADDMGLGKTIQILALLQSVTNPLPTLVVVPKSLVFNWISEAAKFTPQLKVLEYTGSSRSERLSQFSEANLIVTTYGTVRSDILEFTKQKFFYVVLDESQMVKNSSSQIAKAVRLLSAEHRLVLTGTPIENHAGELWSQLEFLNPGMLGKATAFKNKTVDLDGQKEWLASLAGALRPFILRRTKEQVLKDLPPKTEQIIYCDFEEEEQKLYENLRDHCRGELLGKVQENGLGKSNMDILEALLRMRQAACHFGLIDKRRVNEESAKTRALNSRLSEIIESGHKALVFSQFTSFLSIVRKKLDEQKITYEYLDGSTSNRKERVARFQNDPDCPLFLLSLKAGGVGLNLTAADYVFLLDPWWNPAVESQAVDRTHRIGQKKPVMVYRLITRTTVEEKVMELQKKKRALADTVLSTDSSILRKITVEDLKLLLT